MKIDGGCHCGYVTYDAEVNPDNTEICHCTDCQVLSRTAFRILIPAEHDSFRILSGEPTIYVKTAESGAKREQAFCPRCGTPIYAAGTGDGPKIYRIRGGTVRQRNQFVPKRQIWLRSQQRWLAELGSIPGVDKQQQSTRI
ncbi:MAG TPA: GFA family protein [Xanthobacteraceae bacterium]